MWKKCSDNQTLDILFILKSNKKRFGPLLTDFHKDYLKGSNSYPLTFVDAFSLLLNHRLSKKTPTAYPTNQTKAP